MPSLRVVRDPRATLLLAALWAAACSGTTTPTSTPPPPLAANTIVINNATVTVAIASTNAARDNGLMGVTRMAADSGMLFVFADDRQRAFWMCHTPIPLSIIFLDANKKIIFMADMAPNTTTIYGGLNAAQMRYALEVNQGWFASHGITLNMFATFTLPAGLVIEPDAQGSSTCSP
jgi:uncharacterized membrane protein (UPF0127 family)